MKEELQQHVKYADNRKDAWTPQEDEVLGKIVVRATREGKDLNEAIKIASFRTGRTTSALQARWHNVVKPFYEVSLAYAKRDASEKKEYGDIPDTRYNDPKAMPKTEYVKAKEVIEANPIYREVKRGMIHAQARQVAYGMDKYPEPLNADTWTEIETIDHIISETIDKLHYLTMLKIKLQQRAEGE